MPFGKFQNLTLLLGAVTGQRPSDIRNEMQGFLLACRCQPSSAPEICHLRTVRTSPNRHTSKKNALSTLARPTAKTAC